ncbi:MAG: carbonic anhydrase, partial [Lacipirellulaceae bacterium]
LLNMIPLSVLAAILILTGFKLASPKVMKQMWEGGRYQFIPFVVTILAIMGIDLLYGVLIGLVVAMSFILNSNLRRPIRQFVEKHVGGDITRIELAEQVSFFKRASLTEVLDNIPQGGHVLLDATKTDYIDPDVLNLIREYKEKTGPARDVQVSLQGFRSKYEMEDHIQFVDYATRELQEAITPAQVLEVLKEGHKRFLSGERINRNASRHVDATADAQHPLAVVLSCIDSRAPVELIFDAGLGDLFTVRVAGNVTSEKVLGSIEYGCAVAGARLILVMGHTRCGAVTAAVDTALAGQGVAPGDCLHIDPIITEISEAIDRNAIRELGSKQGFEKQAYVNMVARENVHRVVDRVKAKSPAIAKMVETGQVAIVGALYDVVSGEMEFFSELMLDESDRVGPVVEA